MKVPCPAMAKRRKTMVPESAMAVPAVRITELIRVMTAPETMKMEAVQEVGTPVMMEMRTVPAAVVPTA